MISTTLSSSSLISFSVSYYYIIYCWFLLVNFYLSIIYISIFLSIIFFVPFWFFSITSNSVKKLLSFHSIHVVFLTVCLKIFTVIILKSLAGWFLSPFNTSSGHFIVFVHVEDIPLLPHFVKFPILFYVLGISIMFPNLEEVDLYRKWPIIFPSGHQSLML